LCDQLNGNKESYLENCFFYIHHNPLEAELVKELYNWPYSSFRDYIELRNGSLCNKELFFQLTELNRNDIARRANEKIEDWFVAKFYV
jgi:putative transposase